MTDKQISRRELLRLAGMMGGAAFLAACGAAPAASTPTTAPAAATEAAAAVPTVAPAAAATTAPAAAGGESLTLKVLAENWGDIYDGLMEKIGEAYTQENPNVKIDWSFEQDWQTKLTTQLAANTVPDCTTIRPGALANLGRKGQLADLGPYVQSAGLTRDDFVASIYDSCVYDGKLYAIPGGADYICMFWSKTLYKEAGLDPEKPPTTVEELLAHSKQILKRDENGDIQRVGYVPSAYQFTNWAFIHGGKFFDIGSNKITANDPINVSVLTWMAEYMKELDVDKLAAFQKRPGTYEAGNPFSTKQSAYIFDGFWTYDALDQHSPDIDYGVTFWPTVKGTEAERKNYSISGWMYTMPKGAPHPDASWDFLRYAFIDQSAKMGYLTLNGPCVKKAFPAFLEGLKKEMGPKNRMYSQLDYFTRTGEAATNFFPIIPVQSFYNDELNRVFDLVVRGQQTPQAALDEVTKNVQAELDKLKA